MSQQSIQRTCELMTLLLFASIVSAETWTQKGFDDFSKGRFEDAGSNAYVSAAGAIQVINRQDLNNDGHLDLFIGNGHGHTENEDLYVYFNNGREIDPLRRMALPTDSAIHGLVADLNKDGKNDLVVVNTTGGITSRTDTWIYYGTDKGFTVERRVKLKAWKGQAAAVGDFNGDGWLDLAIACANRTLYPDPKDRDKEKTASSVVYWNSPDGFDNARKADIPGAASFVIASDLNGDKRADLAFASGEGTTVYWAADGGVDVAHPLKLPLGGSHLAAADLDNDGHQDMLVLKGNTIDVLPGGAGGPSKESKLKLTLLSASQMAAADFNGDKLPDLAVACPDQMGNDYTNSRIFWNKGGNLNPDGYTQLPTVNARAISAGDLNGDGKPDLVISNHKSQDTLSVQSFVYWNHEGSFDPVRKTMLDTKGAQGNCIGDLDNDGKPDVVFFNFEGGMRDSAMPAYLYWGDGTRNFSPTRRTDLWSVYCTGTIQADFNDDGWVDLAGLMSRWTADKPGTLHGLYLWYGGAEGFNDDRRAVLSVQNPGGGCGTADINRDGYLDLITGADEKTSAGKTGWVILYGGKGGFSPNSRQVVPVGVGYRAPHIIDVNRDGWLDLVGAGDKGLYFVYGSAKGFQTDNIPVLLKGQTIAHVEAADFNKDGWLDLVVPATEKPDRNEADVVILYGSKEGYDESRATRLPHMGGYDPSVADFNKDGHLDIFIPHYAGNLHRSVPCYLYWGSQNGFDPKNRLELPGDSAAASLAADFDADGWTDIFVANHKREGSRDRAGDAINHFTPSFLYWNGPDGFDPARKTDIATVGPHQQQTRDPGNIYTREMIEVYISAPYKPADPSTRAAAIDWTAQTPLKTTVKFQLRSAADEEGLERAPWKGPAGPDTWYEKPGEIPPGGLDGACIQYRARLMRPDGGNSPKITRIGIEFR